MTQNGRADLRMVVRNPAKAAAVAATALIADETRKLLRKSQPRLKDKPKTETLTIKEFSVPAAIGNEVRRSNPKLNYMKSGVHVVNREAIDLSISGSESWTSQIQLDINPGMYDTFPWFAGIAQQYQEYIFDYVRLVWVPIAPTSTKGDVILTPLYDPSLPWPINEFGASDNIHTIVGSCWMSHTCSLSKALMHPNNVKKYVRSKRVAGNKNIFDVAKFQLSSVNQTDTTAIGKLYIEYSCRLYGPVSPAIMTTTGLSNAAIYYLSTDQSFTTGGDIQILAANWLKTYDNLDVVFDSNTWTLPSGNYRIEMFVGFTNSNNEAMYGKAILKDITGSHNYVATGSTSTRSAGTYDLGSYVNIDLESENNYALTSAPTVSFETWVNVSTATSAKIAKCTSYQTLDHTWLRITLL
jgi:hypothetical protein